MRVHRNCCGLDVHKKTIAACMITEDEEGNSTREKRGNYSLLGTMLSQILGFEPLR